MLQAVEGYYANRIYPNVYFMDVKLGQLSPAEARVTLEQSAYSGQLVLRAGEQLWAVPWSEAGIGLDVTATTQAAFAVGHANSGQRLRDRVRVWLRRHDVAPVMAVDEEQAREVLERLAPSLALPATEATLRLEGEQVIVLPGQPGRALDVEATLAQLLAHTGLERPVDLTFKTLPPLVIDVAPIQAQAEELLARRVELEALDVLSDETFAWTLERSDIVSWLRVEAALVSPDAGAVQAALAELAAGLGQGRGLRLQEATGQVMDALTGGDELVALYLTHPARAYVVQSGDTVSSIAAAFGMPAWAIVQANPHANLDWLRVGQELTIPSQDMFTPLAPVPGKRIVVSIAEQRLRAYENGALLYDWPISTGIASSPTSAGVFQVLSKQENAYASLWDLWMPHFISIYPAGPDFYNGFHGLPTLSNGRL
ncbi:MAG: LysM peptidoglycan-binding domain-containing protein, partial [Delftia sp.]|nr:LysM peptidoglycan-binding domain-containing protein [Delftia sp.]